MQKIFLLVLLMAFELFGGVATVVDMVGSSTLKRGGKTLALQLKSELQEHDTIITGSNAKVKIFFHDNTAVSLGKNTSFSIDSYLFDSTKKSKIHFSVVKGFFKTVTGRIGKIAPNRFKLKTKNATIGIRGTVFVAMVTEKEDRILCTDGVIFVKNSYGTYNVGKGKEGSFHSSRKPKIKNYTLEEKLEIIKKAGWKGSRSIKELIAFIKANFKEPLRSQLLATIQNILKKDSDSRGEFTGTQKVNADDISFVDDIKINGREFDSLNDRVIEFYRDDLIDGKVIVDGILESEDKNTPVESLYVEITTDGGETWSRAQGHSEWRWSFEPEIGKKYEFSLRVVKEIVGTEI